MCSVRKEFVRYASLQVEPAGLSFQVLFENSAINSVKRVQKQRRFDRQLITLGAVLAITFAGIHGITVSATRFRRVC